MFMINNYFPPNQRLNQSIFLISLMWHLWIYQFYNSVKNLFSHSFNTYCGYFIKLIFNIYRSVSVLTDLMRQEKTACIFRDRQISLQHTLPLGSYLLKPVQRILKYHLLLQVGFFVYNYRRIKVRFFLNPVNIKFKWFVVISIFFLFM